MNVTEENYAMKTRKKTDAFISCDLCVTPSSPQLLISKISNDRIADKV